MSIFTGINNFLMMILNHWTEITVMASLVYLIYRRAVTFLSKTDDEKIAFAKDLICKTMLEYVSNAEKEYAEWIKAGAAKRSQVIAKIYADFPVLAKVANQEDLINWIDEQIGEALKVMREMIAEKAN